MAFLFVKTLPRWRLLSDHRFIIWHSNFVSQETAKSSAKSFSLMFASFYAAVVVAASGCCWCCCCCFKNRGITQHVLITFHVWIKLGFRSVLARQVTRSALRLLVQPPAQGLKEPVIFNGSVWSRVKWSAYHIGDSLGYAEQEQRIEWLLTKKLLMWGLGSNEFARMKNFNPQFKRSLRRRPFLLHLSFTFSFIMIHLMCLSHSHLLYCYLSLSLSVIHIFSLSL